MYVHEYIHIYTYAIILYKYLLIIVCISISITYLSITYIVYICDLLHEDEKESEKGIYESVYQWE